MLTQTDKHEDVVITKNEKHILAKELSYLLADTYALYVKTQNFHWNVRGPRFPELHKLFETQYLELAAAVDLVAERIRALDALVPASFSEFAKLTTIEEGNEKMTAIKMIQKLAHDHEAVAQRAREILPKAEEANDHGSVDLLSKRMGDHEKAAWMLRSTSEE